MVTRLGARRGGGGTPTTDLSADTLKVAKELAAQSGVPLSTVLTDLVTKGSSLRASSGLGTTTGDRPLMMPYRQPGEIVYTSPTAEIPTLGRNSRSEYLDLETTFDSPIAEVAMDRGYTPRTIELDSRFEENVSRAASASVESPDKWKGLRGNSNIRAGSLSRRGRRHGQSPDLLRHTYCPRQSFDRRPLLL